LAEKFYGGTVWGRPVDFGAVDFFLPFIFCPDVGSGSLPFNDFLSPSGIWYISDVFAQYFKARRRKRKVSCSVEPGCRVVPEDKTALG
jgi:hypothetical protein